MIWKEKHLRTYGVLQQAMADLKTKEEAETFRDVYRRVHDQADRILAILTGYFSDARARELREWMRLVHPLETAKGITALEAFNHGFNTGLKMRPKTRKA